MTFEEIINKSKYYTIRELKALIGNILKEVGYGSILCVNQTFDNLYRARQHNQINGESDDYIFSNEKEFWNPPKECIKKLGRCNDINQSLFYCSNHFETSVLEVRPEKGKYITVANFSPIKQGDKLPSFRIKPNCIQHLKKIKGFKSCVINFDLAERDEKFIAVDDLLDGLFTEVVNEGDEYKYRVTNAITQCMLSNIVNEHKEQFSMNGMIYPSIVNNKNSINILLKPIYAKNNYIIKGLQTFEVLEVLDEYVSIKLVRNGYTKGMKNHPSVELGIEWLAPIEGDSYNINN